MKSRVVLLLLSALAAGCARPLAPNFHRGETAFSSLPRAVAARDSARLEPLLTIVGTTISLDRNFEPVLQRNHVFVVPPDPCDLLCPIRDTVSVGSRIRNLRWLPLGIASLERDQDASGSPGQGDLGANGPLPSGPLYGRHIIRVDAPSRVGGGTVFFRFYANFAPDTWWAGPAPERWPRSSDGDGRAVDVTDWAHFTTVPPWPPDGRPYFGPDSFRYIPSKRRPPGDDFQRRTFYEIFGDRIYARSEGDTVHLHSWVVLCSGGYDKDSEYRPHVAASDPELPPGFAGDPVRYAVLHELGTVGSPIGFRSQLELRRKDDGVVMPFLASGLYPVFDAASADPLPALFGYWLMETPSKAYMVSRAEDGDLLVDYTIYNALDLADHVDAGGGTLAERLYRRKVLTFYVRSDAPRH